jgi:hypothetical protein
VNVLQHMLQGRGQMLLQDQLASLQQQRVTIFYVDLSMSMQQIHMEFKDTYASC